MKSLVVFRTVRRTRRSAYMGSKAASQEHAAAAVYMSHKAIHGRRGESYGHLLEQCIFSSKKLYAMARPEGRPIVSPLFSAFRPRRTAFSEKEIELQLQHIRHWFRRQASTEIVEGPHYDFFKAAKERSARLSTTWATGIWMAPGIRISPGSTISTLSST